MKQMGLYAHARSYQLSCADRTEALFLVGTQYRMYCTVYTLQLWFVVLSFIHNRSFAKSAEKLRGAQQFFEAPKTNILIQNQICRS